MVSEPPDGRIITGGSCSVLDWNSDTVVFIFSRYNSSLITGKRDEANVIAAEILLPDAEVLDMIYHCGYDAFQIARCTGSDVNLVALKCDILVEKGYDLHRIDHQSDFLR